VAQVGKGLTRATGREEWVNSTSGFFICVRDKAAQTAQQSLVHKLPLGSLYARLGGPVGLAAIATPGEPSVRKPLKYPSHQSLLTPLARRDARA
jgi:hypothetical protein